MKKTYIILVVIVLGFSSFFLYLLTPTYFLTPRYSIMIDPTRLSEQVEKHPFIMAALCPWPEEGDYEICCIENNKVVSCKNRDLGCGERIVVMVNFSFDNSKYYLCENKGVLLEELPGAPVKYYYEGGYAKAFMCYKARPEKGWNHYVGELERNKYMIYIPGKVPFKEGNFTLLELYLIPLSTYPAPFEELFPRLGEFEKLVEIQRKITC